MDMADPKAFLRGLETTKRTTVEVDTFTVKAAIREAIAAELEKLANHHAVDISRNVRGFLLARAHDVRNGG